MILLKCKLCSGEVDIVKNDNGINKKTKCQKCGHTNVEPEQNGPEIIFMRRRANPDTK
jgi:uncharacterized Zn finger protein